MPMWEDGLSLNHRVVDPAADRTLQEGVPRPGRRIEDDYPVRPVIFYRLWGTR